MSTEICVSCHCTHEPPHRFEIRARARVGDGILLTLQRTDAAYPGRRFTGRCVFANVVAGSDPDDEACALAGFYYQASAVGTCDVTSEPPLP